MVLPVTEDTPPDMLAGSMDLRVVLPDGHVVKMSVERSTPMMDLLVHATTLNKMTPAGHVLQVMGEHGVLPYKPNTPIGALEAWTIHIVPKNKAQAPLMQKKAPLRPANQQQPFEQTFRLQVHLPRNQLFVMRVSPHTLLCDILQQTCSEKNLDPSKYEMRHPADLSQLLSPSCSLADYGLQEVTVVARSRGLGQALSSSDIMALQREEDKRRQVMRQQQSSAGLSLVLNKRSQSSVCEGSISSDSLGGRSISPARSDESASRSASPPAPIMAPPTRPARKRRPAPKPPAPPQRQAHKPNANVNQQQEEAVNVSHSRNSSDSSGYHEASVLSDGPADMQHIPDTLPRRNKMAAKSQVGLSRSMSSLTAATSTSSLSSMSGLKKKKAPPPPPVNKTTSLERHLSGKSSSQPQDQDKCSTLPGKMKMWKQEETKAAPVPTVFEVVPVESTSVPAPVEFASPAAMAEVEEAFSCVTAELDNIVLPPPTSMQDAVDDWQYQLPAPPSAFRDSSSPTLADEETVDLASAQMFAESESVTRVNPLFIAQDFDVDVEIRDTGYLYDNDSRTAIGDRDNETLNGSASSREDGQQITELKSRELNDNINSRVTRQQLKEAKKLDDMNSMEHDSEFGQHVSERKSSDSSLLYDISSREYVEEIGRTEPRDHVAEIGRAESRDNVAEIGISESWDHVAEIGISESWDHVAEIGRAESRDHVAEISRSESRDHVAEIGRAESRDHVAEIGRAESRDNVAEIGRAESRDHAAEIGRAESRNHVAEIGRAESRDHVAEIGRAESRDHVAEIGRAESRHNVAEIRQEIGRAESRDHAAEIRQEIGRTESRDHVAEIGRAKSRDHAAEIRQEIGRTESRDHVAEIRQENNESEQRNKNMAASRSNELSNFTITTYQRPRLSDEIFQDEESDLISKPTKLYMHQKFNSTTTLNNSTANLSRTNSFSDEAVKRSVSHISLTLQPSKTQSVSNLTVDEKKEVRDEERERLLELQEQFLHLQKQLLQNSSLLEKQSSTADPPLQSLQVLRSILPQLGQQQERDGDGSKSSEDAESSRSPQERRNSNESGKQSTATTVNNEKPAEPKRYVYRGPPAVNFTTWSERPKSEVSIKMDGDYRIGIGQGNQKLTKKKAVEVEKCDDTTPSKAPQHNDPSRVPIVLSVELKKSFIEQQNLHKSTTLLSEADDGNTFLGVNSLAKRFNVGVRPVSAYGRVENTAPRKYTSVVGIGADSETSTPVVKKAPAVVRVNGFSAPKHLMPVVKGFQFAGPATSNLQRSDSKCGVDAKLQDSTSVGRSSKNNQIPAPRPKTLNSRDQLMDAIKNFGGGENLRQQSPTQDNVVVIR